MPRSTATRPKVPNRLTLSGVLTTVASADNTIYYYNNALWRKKSANTKILQKSIDGTNWSDVYTFTFNVGVVIVCANGNILVSQKSDDNWFVDPPAQLYLSTDGGVSFNSVLTYTSGGFESFSYDVYQNTVFVGEYGKYNALNVYRSTDGGANWTTVFTHPVDGSATVHIHKVYIDNVTPTTIYISTGDETAAKGVWYSSDNGATWAAISRNTHQPTWLVADDTYLYLGEDLEGKIHRIKKTNFALGDSAIETVYDAQTDPRGSFGNLSFYGGAYDNGIIFFGGVAYGRNDIHNNNKNAVLIASTDKGDSWAIVKQYGSAAAASSGPSVFSKLSDAGLFYVKSTNPTIVQTMNSQNVRALINAAPNRSTATRQSLNKNLIGNGNFEIAPAGSTGTGTAVRWIDGTAGGSAAQKAYGWAIPSGGLSGTATALFDTAVARSGSYSLKLTLANISSGLTVANYRNSPGATMVKEFLPILPNTTYVITAYIKGASVAANGAYVDFRTLDSVGTTLITTSSNKLSGTFDWTQVSIRVTTGSTARYAAIFLRNNVLGSASTVWFDDVEVRLATSPTRVAVS
jgi:hypothetical protein